MTIQGNRVGSVRFDQLSAAMAGVPRESPLLVLADGYPERMTEMTAAQFEPARKKKLRLYIEYPARLPGLEVAPPARLKIERAVVTSDFFGPAALTSDLLPKTAGSRISKRRRSTSRPIIRPIFGPVSSGRITIRAMRCSISAR